MAAIAAARQRSERTITREMAQSLRLVRQDAQARNRLCVRLIVARREAGLTVEQVAAEVSCRATELTALERGKGGERLLMTSSFTKLAKVLGLDSAATLEAANPKPQGGLAPQRTAVVTEATVLFIVRETPVLRKAFATECKRIREKAGVSQEEAATTAGVPLVEWQRLESLRGGEQAITTGAMARLRLLMPLHALLGAAGDWVQSSRYGSSYSFDTGERLRCAREEQGIGILSLAQAVGVEERTIKDLERNRYTPSVLALRRLCLRLGVSSDFVLAEPGVVASPFIALCPADMDSADVMPFVGAQIRRAREVLSWSQGKLAVQVEGNQAQISGYERGRVTPTAARLRQLAKALGVSMDWLLGLVIDDGGMSE